MASEKIITYEKHISSETIFYKLFQNIRYPLLILHPKTFKIIDANTRALNFFYYTASEIKKKHLFSLVNVNEQEEFSKKIELQKSKSSFSLHMPLQTKNGDTSIFPVHIENISIKKISGYAALIDTENTEKIILEEKLKNQNKELTEQVKRLVDINRKIVTSYENIKKQYQELLEFQDENVKNERHRTIGEMSDVLQDKINKPLNRILDDVQKIHDSEKKLTPSIVKRLKLIEESAENILRVMARISEVKDIKKMKYIELNNM